MPPVAHRGGSLGSDTCYPDTQWLDWKPQNIGCFGASRNRCQRRNQSPNHKLFLDPHQILLLCINWVSADEDNTQILSSNILSTVLQQLPTHPHTVFPWPVPHDSEGCTHIPPHPYHNGSLLKTPRRILVCHWLSQRTAFQQQWHNTSLISQKVTNLSQDDSP